MAAAGGQERRKYIRLISKNILDCGRYSLRRIDLKKEVQAITKDISAGGILFESKKPFNVGDVLKLEVDLPGWEKFKTEFYKSGRLSQSAPVVTLASVVRVEIVKPGQIYDIGVCFVGIDEGHQWALMKYIKNKTKGG